MSFHIHFHSPGKSASLLASTCIHRHNAKAEAADWKHTVHLFFRDIFETADRDVAVVSLHTLMNHIFRNELISKMSACSAVFLSVIKKVTLQVLTQKMSKVNQAAQLSGM